eukprot:m.172363 g.172363  ORF g.172363 m.172363 type:complete len:293 (+) comp31683_c0_seq2:325-1203(+)
MADRYDYDKSSEARRRSGTQTPGSLGDFQVPSIANMPNLAPSSYVDGRQRSCSGSSNRSSASGANNGRRITKEIVLYEFCRRQFKTEDVADPSFTGQIIDFPPITFEQNLNTMLDTEMGLRRTYNSAEVMENGYAPFVKILYVDNFVENLLPSVVEISGSNKDKMRSTYETRTAHDLPMLTRWCLLEDVINDESCIEKAKYLQVTMYSAEYILRDSLQRGKGIGNCGDIANANWGVISIKGVNEKREVPMTPASMMKGALPRECGGLGVTLNMAKYRESIQYWETHVTVRSQ